MNSEVRLPLIKNIPRAFRPWTSSAVATKAAFAGLRAHASLVVTQSQRRRGFGGYVCKATSQSYGRLALVVASCPHPNLGQQPLGMWLLV
jgi:hypothetical protein